MPVFKIQHITKYKYDRPVRESANQIKIFSFNKPGQEILSHEVVITDEPSINKFTDYWSNTVGFLPFPNLMKNLLLTAGWLLKQLCSKLTKHFLQKRLGNSAARNKQQYDFARFGTKRKPEISWKIQLILDHIYNEAYSPLETTKNVHSLFSKTLSMWKVLRTWKPK